MALSTVTRLGAGAVSANTKIAAAVVTNHAVANAAIAGRHTTVPLFQCQLVYSNTTILTLNRKDGSFVFINGLNRQIPTTAPTINVSGAAGANTNHYIYAAVSGGTIVLEKSTTGYATDPTYGHAVKSGDATRTLVGLARTTASTLWADSATQRFVLSYYNRRHKELSNEFTAVRSTSSTTPTEVNSEIRVEYLTWANEATWQSVRAQASNNTAAHQAAFGVGIDSTTVLTNKAIFITSTVANDSHGSTVSFWKTLSEGNHFTTLLGFVDLGTSTANYAYASGPNSQGNSRVEVGIFG